MLYECKVFFIACTRQFFPDRPVFVNLLSEKGKTHPHFVTLTKILEQENIDPKFYIPFVFSRSEKRPTVKQLSGAEWVMKFKHENGREKK